MRVLAILGHPNKESFCAALHKSYVKGAKQTKAEVKELILADMKFNLNYLGKSQKDEPDIAKARKLIEWADHVVITYPMWWGSTPALLKGFFDRMLTSGWAFKQHSATKWDKLLKGKSARIITTAGGLRWVYKLITNPSIKQLKVFTLQYVGFTVKVTSIYGVKPGFEKAKACIKKIEKLGRELK